MKICFKIYEIYIYIFVNQFSYYTNVDTRIELQIEFYILQYSIKYRMTNFSVGRFMRLRTRALLIFSRSTM